VRVSQTSRMSSWHALAMVTAGGVILGVGIFWIVLFYFAGPDIPVMNSIGGSANVLVNLIIALAIMGMGGLLLLIGLLLRHVNKR